LSKSLYGCTLNLDAIIILITTEFIFICTRFLFADRLLQGRSTFPTHWRGTGVPFGDTQCQIGLYRHIFSYCQQLPWRGQGCNITANICQRL